MMDSRYNELFEDGWKSLELWAKVAVHNNYVGDDAYGNYISDNTEDFINGCFNSPFDIINSMGEYSVSDDYAWIDDSGNLYSGDREKELPLADVDDMAEYYYNHPSYLKDFMEFDEWYDAVENGFDEDEENLDDEED